MQKENDFLDVNLRSKKINKSKWNKTNKSQTNCTDKVILFFSNLLITQCAFVPPIMYKDWAIRLRTSTQAKRGRRAAHGHLFKCFTKIGHGIQTCKTKTKWWRLLQYLKVVDTAIFFPLTPDFVKCAAEQHKTLDRQHFLLLHPTDYPAKHCVTDHVGNPCAVPTMKCQMITSSNVATVSLQMGRHTGCFIKRPQDSFTLLR